MSEYEEKIAKIEYADILYEDHGFLTVLIQFNFGGSVQSIPPRIFGLQDEKAEKFDQHRLGHEMGMDFIRRILNVCGVDKWSQVVGRTLLVTSSWTDISKLAPLPTERGEAFDMKEWAESYEKLKETASI